MAISQVVTLSPILSFSIGTSPFGVSTRVPATKQPPPEVAEVDEVDDVLLEDVDVLEDELVLEELDELDELELDDEPPPQDELQKDSLQPGTPNAAQPLPLQGPA